MSIVSGNYIPSDSFPREGAVIAYQQYALPNGLQVILHRNTNAPIVHVLVWYHVGSKNEERHRTGFAHLFEHMMFQGSENIGKTEHFKYVQEVGGILNASTSQDRTNYFQTLPSEHLELGLWLEADRMRSLHVTEANYQNQLSVVKEERKQNYDNRPYGLWYLTILEMLFGNTQYAWGPIGDMAHLDASGVDTVRDFHSRYYLPNNATLVIAGDFEPEETQKLIEQHFADIRPGEEIARPAPVAADEAGINAINRQDRTVVSDVPFPTVYIGFRSPGIGHADIPALSILAVILSHGRSSRLQKRMVYDEQVAQEVYALNRDMETAGMFVILATAAGETRPEELEAAIGEELMRLHTEDVSDYELQSAINYIETTLIRNFSTIRSVANSLAEYQVLYGDAAYVNMLVSSYGEVTAADTRRVAQAYLQMDRAAVLNYLPNGEQQ